MLVGTLRYLHSVSFSWQGSRTLGKVDCRQAAVWVTPEFNKLPMQVFGRQQDAGSVCWHTILALLGAPWDLTPERVVCNASVVDGFGITWEISTFLRTGKTKQNKTVWHGHFMMAVSELRRDVRNLGFRSLRQLDWVWSSLNGFLEVSTLSGPSKECQMVA